MDADLIYRDKKPCGSYIPHTIGSKTAVGAVCSAFASWTSFILGIRFSCVRSKWLYAFIVFINQLY